jgi:hypothetical protein
MVSVAVLFDWRRRCRWDYIGPLGGLEKCKDSSVKVDRFRDLAGVVDETPKCGKADVGGGGKCLVWYVEVDVPGYAAAFGVSLERVEKRLSLSG